MKNRYLELIILSGQEKDILINAFENSTNMTEILNSLKLLVKTENAVSALNSFYEKWKKNPLLIDKWFSIQAMFTPSKIIFCTIDKLSIHTDFNF